MVVLFSSIVSTDAPSGNDCLKLAGESLTPSPLTASSLLKSSIKVCISFAEPSFASLTTSLLISILAFSSKLSLPNFFFNTNCGCPYGLTSTSII